MAYSYVWPPSLPQSVQKGFTESGGVLTIRTPQDRGPAKTRYVGSKPQTLNCSFLMSESQVITLETFIKTTIKGTARFGFPHPRLKTGSNPTIVEARIVQQGEGDYYTLSYVAPGFYTVNLQLEILP